MQFLREANSSMVAWLGSQRRAALAYALAVVLFYRIRRGLRLKARATRIPGALCVVTGASAGIGAATCELLAELGAGKVVMLARTEEKLKAKAAEINNRFPGVALVYALDCADHVKVDEMAQWVEQELGTPDIVVNCAGAGRWRYLFEMESDEIAACMNAPYLSAAFVSKCFLPGMIAKDYGSIVNVNSPAGWTSFGGATAYMATRWALRGLSEAMRADVHGTRVHIQEIIIGETESEYFKNNVGSNERIPAIGRLAGVISPRTAAEGIAYTIQTGKPVVGWPSMVSMLMTANEWCPSLMSWLLMRTGWSIDKYKRTLERQKEQQQQQAEQD